MRGPERRTSSARIRRRAGQVTAAGSSLQPIERSLAVAAKQAPRRIDEVVDRSVPVLDMAVAGTRSPSARTPRTMRRGDPGPSRSCPPAAAPATGPPAPSCSRSRRASSSGREARPNGRVNMGSFEGLAILWCRSRFKPATHGSHRAAGPNTAKTRLSSAGRRWTRLGSNPIRNLSQTRRISGKQRVVAWFFFR